MHVQIVELEIDREHRENIELDQDVLVFGRGRPGEGFIPLPRCGGNWLSRTHCTIWRDGRDWWICDGQLGGAPSAAGVYLEGRRLVEPCRLQVGQVFGLLSPPPCEIQLHVVAAPRALEDTLTPAIAHFATGPESQAAVDELREAIARLHEDIAENRSLDNAMRGEVAALATARDKAEVALGLAVDKFERKTQEARERLERLERKSSLLTRSISGLALAISLVLLGFSAEPGSTRRATGIEVGLELLLAIAGGGGLALAGQRRFHGNNQEDGQDADRFFSIDESGDSGESVGGLAAGWGAEGGRGDLPDLTVPLRAVGINESGNRSSGGI